MKFSATLVAVSALVASVAADIAAVKADVATIGTDVSKLNTALQNSQGTSYIEALQIDSLSKTTVKDINTANTDASAVASVSESDAQDIISSLSATYANVQAASQRLITLYPAFKKLGVAGIAKTDVNNLATATKTFGATLVAKAPADLQASASSLAAEYNAALASAVAVYASS